MTRSHESGIDIVSEIKQPVPLDSSVAPYTWVGRLSAQVCLYERLSHMFFEFRQAVDVIERYLKLHGRPARIIDVAAAAVCTAFRLPRSQSHAYDLIALLFQKICSCRAVNAARKPDYNSCNADHLLSS